MVNYKNGDRIKCINPGAHINLTLNKIYICAMNINGAIGVAKDDRNILSCGFFNWRFEKFILKLSNKIKIL